MSGLLFLCSNDFKNTKGPKGDLMCCRIQGMSLVLFYSTKCVYCKELIPIFKNLPGTIKGCQFAMINISVNKDCVKMSKQTLAPLVFVPTIILYIDGKPFVKYNGEYSMSSIKSFVINIAEKIKNKQTFMGNSGTDTDSIPEYSLFKPCNSNKVCYLNVTNAY